MAYPYSAYLKAELPLLKKSRPGLAHGEAMRLLGQMWRNRHELAVVEDDVVDTLADVLRSTALGV